MVRIAVATIVLWVAGGCTETERPYVDRAVRERVIARGSECTQWFYDGRYEDLAARFRGSLRESMPVERLRTMREELAENYGPETQVVEQGVGDLGELTIYRRVVRFERQPAPVEVQWTLDARGDIHGFYLRPANPESPTP